MPEMNPADPSEGGVHSSVASIARGAGGPRVDAGGATTAAEIAPDSAWVRHLQHHDSAASQAGSSVKERLLSTRSKASKAGVRSPECSSPRPTRSSAHAQTNRVGVVAGLHSARPCFGGGRARQEEAVVHPSEEKSATENRRGKEKGWRRGVSRGLASSGELKGREKKLRIG